MLSNLPPQEKRCRVILFFLFTLPILANNAFPAHCISQVISHDPDLKGALTSVIKSRIDNWAQGEVKASYSERIDTTDQEVLATLSSHLHLNELFFCSTYFHICLRTYWHLYGQIEGSTTVLIRCHRALFFISLHPNEHIFLLLVFRRSIAAAAPILEQYG